MVTSLDQYSVAEPAGTRGVICLGVDVIGEVAIEVVAELAIIAAVLFGGKPLSGRAFRLLSAA